MNDPRAGEPAAGEEGLSEEELRARLEEELKRVRVDDVLIQSAVSLLNIGARRAGLAGGGDDEVDLSQVEAAIEAAQALLAVLDRRGTEDLGPLRDALAQLQLVYARRSGAGEGGAEPAKPGGEGETATDAEAGPKAGPAQSSGRLWVPGS
jgi:hypothetical protein